MIKRLLSACLLLLLATPVLALDWQTMSFDQIREAAKGTTVRIYMYGGWAHVNQWMDGWVADQLKKRYEVTLERAPMDAPVFVTKMLSEKLAGRDPGSIDMVWINGENFKNAMEADLLLGPYPDKCPNYKQFVDKTWVGMDFGYPTKGHEAPWGQAQFVFEYDEAATPAPPASFAALKDWVKANPGRFTYPQPPDFTGSAFIRQVFYAVTGGHEQYMKGFDQELFDRQAPKLWAYLNEIEPYLWQEGKTYPRDSAGLDTLFSRGEVDLNMSYHPAHAQSKILEGAYPKTARTFVMEEGSIFNLHFTAIAANAPNIAGALIVSDFLMSPEAQLAKYDPNNWGDFPILDLKTLPEAQRKAFENMDLGAATLSLAELNARAVPEIPSAYVEALESGWEEHVLR